MPRHDGRPKGPEHAIPILVKLGYMELFCAEFGT